jgi:hypothetical protein
MPSVRSGSHTHSLKTDLFSDETIEAMLLTCSVFLIRKQVHSYPGVPQNLSVGAMAMGLRPFPLLADGSSTARLSCLLWLPAVLSYQQGGGLF